MSKGYKLANAASGAIVGGLLFGSAGALLGAGSGKKELKEIDKEKVIIFGEKYKQYWVVGESYHFERAFNDLSNHFPNQKYADSYSK